MKIGLLACVIFSFSFLDVVNIANKNQLVKIFYTILDISFYGKNKTYLHSYKVRCASKENPYQ